MNETQMIEHTQLPDLTGMQCYKQPYFSQKDVEIWNENCIDTMMRMEANSVDLVVTSPPYDEMREYKGYTFPFEEIASMLYRTIKPGGVIVWVVGDQTVKGSETLTSFKQVLYFKKIGFNVETMIWEKTGSGCLGSNKFYGQNFEYMFILIKGIPKTTNLICDRDNKVKSGSVKVNGGLDKAGKGKDRIVERKPFGKRNNIWRFDTQKNSDHPAPFPEQLANDHILSWSNEGDLVYDPFGGSGTTMKMAHLQKRRVIMSEISTEYCRMSKNRIEPYMSATLF